MLKDKKIIIMIAGCIITIILFSCLLFTLSTPKQQEDNKIKPLEHTIYGSENSNSPQNNLNSDSDKKLEENAEEIGKDNKEEVEEAEGEVEETEGETQEEAEGEVQEETEGEVEEAEGEAQETEGEVEEEAEGETQEETKGEVEEAGGEAQEEANENEGEYIHGVTQEDIAQDSIEEMLTEDVVEEISPENIILSKDKITLDMNENNQETLEATIIPEDSNTQNEIVWTSSNEDVVQIDENGVLNYFNNGTAIIKATTTNGKEATCEVIVQTSPQDINLNAENAIIEKNHIGKLEAIIEPESANINTKVEWKSSNENIATVDQDGTIISKMEGNVTIIATTENGKEASCELLVEKEKIYPESIELNKNEVTIDLSKDVKDSLFAVIKPIDSNTQNNVIWESSNDEIVQVDQYGNLIGINNGTAMIKVTTENGKEAICEVTVQTTPEEIIMNKTAINETIDDGEIVKQKLEVIIKPQNANTKNKVSWTSTNEEIATVTQDGEVEIKKPGRTTIIATTENGKSVRCSVLCNKLEILPKELELSKEQLILDMSTNNQDYLSATVIPANSNMKNNIIWTSSNEEVVKVSQNGKIEGIKNGTAIITATTENGKNSQCRVIVQTSPETIRLNTKNAIIENNHTGKLEVAIAPESANVNTKIEWISSDEKIATISQDGIITAKKEGNVTITAITENGKIDSCKIVVEKEKIYPESIQLNKAQTVLDLNGVKQEKLVATINPSNSNIQNNIAWASSNAKIVKVDQSGNIVGVSAGTAVITVKTGNGKQATCTVTVKRSEIVATKITLNKTITAIDTKSKEGWYITAKEKEYIDHKNKKVQLKVTSFEPKNANNKNIIWSVQSGDQIVKVNKNGEVTGLNGGIAVVRATLQANPKVYAECTVYVVHSLYENATLTKKVKASVQNSTEKVTIAKGTTVELLGVRYYDSNKVLPVRLKSGKIVEMNVKNLKFKSYHIDDAYPNAVYEEYINNGDFTSKTDYLLWVNQGTQRLMLFKKNKNGIWKLKEIHETSTGDVENTHGSTGIHFDFQIKDFAVENPSMGPAIHMQCIKSGRYFGNTVHIGVIPKDSSGHPLPSSHGCPHVTVAVRNKLYNTYNKGTQNKLVGSRVIYF